MRLFLALLLAWSAFAHGQQRPRDIDPNTKIEGGADVRSSGANAGAGTSTRDKTEPEKSPPRSRGEPDPDKPTSERKPRERHEETLSPPPGSRQRDR